MKLGLSGRICVGTLVYDLPLFVMIYIHSSHYLDNNALFFYKLFAFYVRVVLKQKTAKEGEFLYLISW